jgi:hypothetical protein
LVLAVVLLLHRLVADLRTLQGSCWASTARQGLALLETLQGVRMFVFGDYAYDGLYQLLCVAFWGNT